jgi:hypothetical protein
MPVSKGWNLLGSISDPIWASSIRSEPPGIITSNFFGYSGTYTHVDVILPGSAYWVNVSEDALLTFSSDTSLNPGRIRIVPTLETPPPLPLEAHGDPIAMPSTFVLEQNHPNPFNPLTFIEYRLPADVQVTLKVYDVLGREMATIVDGLEHAGTYAVQWDASRVPSGIYFYRLRTGNFSTTRKLIVLD